MNKNITDSQTSFDDIVGNLDLKSDKGLLNVSHR